MELIQNLLTLFAEAVVICGISGIILHAFFVEYLRFMTEVCPPVKPYQNNTELVESQKEIELLIQEIQQRASLAGAR